MRVSKTSKIIENEIGDIKTMFACFSSAGYPIASIRSKYDDVLKRIDNMLEQAEFTNDQGQADKLLFFKKVITGRCCLMSPC